MTEKFTPFDEALREKLNGYNDVINDSVFAQLQLKRTYQQKLNDVNSDVTPISAFEQMQFKRALQQKLNNSTTDVPSGMFENVEFQKALQSKIDSLEPPVRSVLFDRMNDKRVLQNKLKDFESSVSSNLFDKIQTARKERKPKFAFYYWAAASVAACLLLWLMSSKISLTNNVKNNATVNSDSSKNILKEKNENVTKPPSSEKNISAMQEKNKLSKVENKKNSFSFDQKNNLNTVQSICIDGDKKNKKLVYQRSNSTINENGRTQSQKFKEQNALSNTKENSTTSSSDRYEYLVESPLSPKKIIIDSSENISNVVDFSKQPDNIFPIEISKSNNSNTRVKGGSNNLETKTAQLLNTQLYTKGIKSLKPQTLCGPGDECPTFTGARLRNAVRAGIFFEPYIGGGFINRTLAENTGDYTAYRQRRDSVETAQFALQVGAMLGYQFRNGFHVSTGIRYERISEKATYDSLGVGQISYIVSINPNTGISDTSAKVITDGIFRKTRYNTISSFEIPIRLGYTMVLNRDWALDFTASAGFNFATLTKQSILNPELVLADNTDVSNSYFKKSYGWSTGLSVGVSRALSANTQILVSAYGNYKTSPVTTTDYVLTQKYSTYGVNIAWRYQF